jgi:hypothetical protein
VAGRIDVVTAAATAFDLEVQVEVVDVARRSRGKSDPIAIGQVTNKVARSRVPSSRPAFVLVKMMDECSTAGG